MKRSTQCSIYHASVVLLVCAVAFVSCDPPVYATSYTLADVVRDVKWRQSTAIMLQRMGDNK